MMMMMMMMMMATTVKKLRRVELLMKLHLRAIGCHLPSENSQFSMPPNTITEHNPTGPPRLNPNQRLVLNLPTAEGRKAKLT